MATSLKRGRMQIAKNRAANPYIRCIPVKIADHSGALTVSEGLPGTLREP